MKKICVVIPTYNEKENARAIYEAVKREFETKLTNYDYEILFADNRSTDGTRAIIENIAKEDPHVHAIFNARNYGQFASPFNAIIKSDADATMTICADFQDPPELISSFVAKWEEGYKIVCGVKTRSKENFFVRFLRNVYYKIFKKFASVSVIEHFTGFGIYDRSFVDILRELDEPEPFIRSLVCELGYNITTIEYTQPRRRAGKSSNNITTLYDAAMLSFTSYTKVPIRAFMILGIILFVISIISFIVFAALKMIIPLLFCTVGIFSSIGYIFLSIIGEYILAIKAKVTRRPLVIEEKRI
ncbi:MAG: glycosyltransferase family 2 protein [Eubacteriales bacterium]